ncbi:hypothetical protein BC937DRAFT_95022 [Endogone sp. FLAS-F59071]|nr:hypothetical protein BC937DRAFT_95022 [Endogone sp. FLAS-F59071]|eukprot:RUS20521.1 hypothetical protein BC937DRAFT_95022 [Endogone sp. FLAS-F59071]
MEDTHMEISFTSNTNPEGSATSSTKTTSIKFLAKSITTTLKHHLNTHHLENLISEANTPVASALFSQEHTTKYLIKWIVCDLQPFTITKRLEF